MLRNYLLLLSSLMFLLLACNSKTDLPAQQATVPDQSQVQAITEQALITFIELGSVKCIPVKGCSR